MSSNGFIFQCSVLTVKRLQPIPVFTNLKDLYASLGTSLNHAERWNNLAEEFEKRFGKPPTYIARAPGRVNLIGEHIDYALFGVLPAAIERDILIACAPRECPRALRRRRTPRSGKRYRRESQPKIYPSGVRPAPKAKPVNIDDEQLRWENYVKAGYYGLAVTGSVPAGSGLSSSAAMVVASTLAFLPSTGRLQLEGTEQVAKGELVKMSMENEKRVGTMDQAASVMSVPSSVLYITFYPSLTASPTPLPGAHGERGYNLRVVETLVGARALARTLNIPVGAREKITLREVVGRLVAEADVGKGGAVEQLKPPGSTDAEFGATMEEMVAMSGLSAEEFHEVYISWVEAVLDTAAAPPAADGNFAALKQLGQLMNDSQVSCAGDFECSCEELDQLTQLARDAGAYGSRLTGAGWGGCTVSLVPESEVDSFIKKVSETYPPYKGLEGDALSEVIFATRPSTGACVYKFD
ncbi:ribosomal protein S5 domain 2-type protein [Mycena leptocephala]|nr:ribosomal protein S5 domain 2-type protein [Mycena leptocephala]